MYSYLLIALIGLSASLGSLASDPDSFDTIHEKVFGNVSDLVSPTETLKLLERLLTFEDEFNIMMENGEIPEDAQFKDMKLIKEMIEASQIRSDKCDLNSIMSFNIMLRQNTNHPNNAIPYLEHYKSEQFKKCKDVFTNMLNRAVNRLTGEQKTKVAALLDSIKRQSGQENVANSAKCAHLTGKQLDLALVDYLKTIWANYDEQSLRKEWRNHPEARKEIMAICGQVVRELDESVDIFNEFIGDKVLTDHLDQTMTDWIFATNVCRHILQMVDESATNEANQQGYQPTEYCPKYCPGYYHPSYCPGHYYPGGSCHGGSGYPGGSCHGGGGYYPGGSGCCSQGTSYPGGCCTGGSGYPGGRCTGGCSGSSSSCSSGSYTPGRCSSQYPGYCPGRCGQGCGCQGSGKKTPTNIKA